VTTTAAHEGPPARPAKESAVPSPLAEFSTPHPRVLTLSVGCWVLSALVGFVITGYFIVRLAGVRAVLETTMRTEAPDVDETSLETAIDITVTDPAGAASRRCCRLSPRRTVRSAWR